MIDGRWWPRWFAEWWAKSFGYFWLPCPLCGEYFGGMEWHHSTDTLPTTEPGYREGHCGKRTCRSRAKDYQPQPPRTKGDSASGKPKIDLAQGEIASVTLKPGDRLVIMFQQTLMPEVVERLSEQMKGWAPGVPCMVMDSGARLGVIRASDDLDANPAA